LPFRMFQKIGRFDVTHFLEEPDVWSRRKIVASLAIETRLERAGEHLRIYRFKRTEYEIYVQIVDRPSCNKTFPVFLSPQTLHLESEPLTLMEFICKIELPPWKAQDLDIVKDFSKTIMKLRFKCIERLWKKDNENYDHNMTLLDLIEPEFENLYLGGKMRELFLDEDACEAVVGSKTEPVRITVQQLLN
jgi:hypothetical protein